LRTALRTSGQPGFFNDANLPAGDSLNGVSNFWVSSSEAKALGLPLQDPSLADGSVGINTTVTPGAARIQVFLHEIGHAMGRVPDDLVFTDGVTSFSAFSALDLVRFVSAGNRLFTGRDQIPAMAAFFSVDGGTKKVADWATDSPADFLRPPNSIFTPNDSFNNGGFGTTLLKLTTADIQLMEALGFRVGATAAMVLRRSDGVYQSYGIGSNAISASSQLGQVGTDWQFVTLGGFNDSITKSFTSDMLLRNSTTGAFQVYDISNNKITDSFFFGTVALNWQFSGIGNFSGVPGASDMILRNTDTGGLQVYDISNNQITNSFFIGTVGLDWQFSGVGNFSSNPGESDMILRNTNTGQLLVYNIANNQITNSFSIGAVGLDWQFAGVAPIRVPGAADLVLRNVNTGQFQVYNIANNQITGSAPLGTVGTDWQLGGFAPTASNGFIRNSGGPLASQPPAGSTSQLVQAMAGFGGGSGAAETLNAGALGIDTSQQPLLTAPQHA
jgi:hypothetical protein